MKEDKNSFTARILIDWGAADVWREKIIANYKVILVITGRMSAHAMQITQNKLLKFILEMILEITAA